MAQQLNLTVPVSRGTTSFYELSSLIIDLANLTIFAQLRGNNGEVLSKVYNNATTPTGAALITTLNVANNSAGTSLVARVFARLVTDGVLTGTVSGTPT